MIHYATYFDHNYLPRALVLLDSLREHSPQFTLWCLALSPQCAAVLDSLAAPEVRVLRLQDLEKADSALLATKSSRTIAEYFFTLTSCWCRFLLETRPEIDLLTYLDSDLCFYSSPQPLFAEFADASIGIIEHRTTRPQALEAKFGRFNVGLLMFRNDTVGRTCVDRWRDQCIDWCFDRVEPLRYADQKYLDEWPKRYAETHIIRHPGANVAPWNAGRHTFSGTLPNVLVDGQPLIFFHFQRVRQRASGLVDLGLKHYKVSIKKRRWLRSTIYSDYLHRLDSSFEVVATVSTSAARLQTIRQFEGPKPHLLLRIATDIASITSHWWQPIYEAWFIWTGSGIRWVPRSHNSRTL